MTRLCLNPSVLLIGFLVALTTPANATHVDITIQSIGNQIVTGAGTVDENNGDVTLGVDFDEQVYGDALGSNFRSLNPGFNSVASTSPILQSTGAQGFAEGTDIEFDLLPMHIGSTAMNLAYWDGTGAVDFGHPPADTTWAIGIRQGTTRVYYTADGSDTMVPGASVGEVSDINRLHEHHRLEIETVGGGEPEGVYLVSMQLRVAGYETSDPIFLVPYSFNTPISVGDLAQDWVRDNYDTLVGLMPGDFNGDGFVDAADYTVWRDGLGTEYVQADYDEWVANYGAGAAASSGGLAIPEPATAFFFLQILLMTRVTQRPIR